MASDTIAATPIAQVESYFDIELTHKAIKHLDCKSVGDWIDFAKQYQASMAEHFAEDFLSGDLNQEHPRVSLFFEPTLCERWEQAVHQLYRAHSPLLGMQPDPKVEINAASVSQMLEPLKKHLLVADSVFINDSFFQSFEVLAGKTRTGWMDNPAVRHDAEFHVARLKAWLPLLVELRALIESRALVFMPYRLRPSFPYSNFTVDQLNKLKIGMRPPANPDPPVSPPRVDFTTLFSRPKPENASREHPFAPNNYVGGRVDEMDVFAAWVDARLLGLNPVFPDQMMFDFASRLYFKDENGNAPFELTSDLMSIDILPLGKSKPISVKTMLKLRQNEDGFDVVRRTLLDCQDKLRVALTSEATQRDAKILCQDVISSTRAEMDGRPGRVVKFLEGNIGGSTAFNLVVGAAMVPAAAISAAAGVLGGVLLSPASARWAMDHRNSASRALAQLQALL